MVLPQHIQSSFILFVYLKVCCSLCTTVSLIKSGVKKTPELQIKYKMINKIVNTKMVNCCLKSKEQLEYQHSSYISN